MSARLCRTAASWAMTAVICVGLCLVGAALGGSSASAASMAGTSDTSNCPSYNLPNELVLASGTPQSAKLGTPFAANLAVSLANSNGCPITTTLSGIAVTFTAPASGPSGTFSSSGSNAVLVGTGDSGTATAPPLTANTLPGGYQVVASSEVGSVSFSLVNTASGVPATVVALSPGRQSATVSNLYPHPLQAQVLDANGAPVAGATVSFVLGSSGGGQSGAAGAETSPGAAFQGGANQANEQTDASGIATSPPFVANAGAGRFTATATVAGSNATATFALDNLAARPPRIAAVGSTHRSATVGARYRAPLTVKVQTAQGAALQGVAVTFTLGAGGGGGSGGEGAAGAGAASAGASFVGGASEATETTNARGIAVSPRFSANSTAGAFTATATVSGSNSAASFRLDNLAGKPVTVTAGAGATESTSVGTRFPIRLAVTVTDEDGNPVAGVLVAFSAPARGPSGRFAGSRGKHPRKIHVHTNANGVAIAPPFGANRTVGGYAVGATVRGAAPAAFALVNQPTGL